MQIDIGTLTNKKSISDFLYTDKAYHAYALADLDEPFFSQCEWWAAQSTGEMQTMVLHFKGLNPPAILPMGSAIQLPQILSAMDLPAEAMMLGQGAHIEVLRQWYRFDYLDEMWRMVLSPERFLPISPSESVQRLDHRHLPALLSIYENEHGNAFAPYQLEQGVFFGIFDDTELLSVAGTHIIAPEYGVAAVGNIVTKSAHRGRGLAQQCTTRVCQQLFSMGIDTVVLNVMQSNDPAIHIYEKMGFEKSHAFLEGVGTKIV